MRNYHELAKQDSDDAMSIAYKISSPLHFSTKTEKCIDPLTCLLCKESARLVIQNYRQIIEARVVESLMDAYNVRCTMPHPGGD